MKVSQLEMLFMAQAKGRIPVPATEYVFHPTRKWRFDLCWPISMLALEIEGGVWSGGHHARPAGILRDIEKYNAATMLGWRVLRATTAMVEDGSALELVAAALSSASTAVPARPGRQSA